MKAVFSCFSHLLFINTPKKCDFPGKLGLISLEKL